MMKKCSTCQTEKEFEEFNKSKSGKLDFCADHNHATKTKRGVLCRKCNAGLGHFNDNPEVIAKAIKYLSHYTK